MPRTLGNGGSSSTFVLAFIDRPQVVENIPRVGITFPNGTHIFSNQDDINHTLSKVLGRDVRLMRASLEKPTTKMYWPDIEGLAQREKVTDEAMTPQTFFENFWIGKRLNNWRRCRAEGHWALHEVCDDNFAQMIFPKI